MSKVDAAAEKASMHHLDEVNDAKSKQMVDEDGKFLRCTVLE
jgi:hypothetical protein